MAYKSMKRTVVKTFIILIIKDPFLTHFVITIVNCYIKSH